MPVPCGLVFHLKDGGSRFLPIIASTLTSEMVSHPRTFLYSLLREPHISCVNLQYSISIRVKVFTVVKLWNILIYADSTVYSGRWHPSAS